ncbi:ribonuclease T2 family protein [Roseobacter litoralis]|uniref:Ribonuclease T2-like protein n=1 Tax=Roseobacter litoralis (strain ATCC 49566 / DSM 6996 / JCM 21268 / NBRC 15278 / OCh 149) TaxID=391595 RepID=F7ZFT6_ROSLO|nr:ribonuclease T2 [Roseobacter litoralis]AEI92276.1 ribonuclease T2-like protein [Roseobacter litoralis Och 149]
MRWLIASLIAALPFGAQSDTTGTFDYYVLSLSWSPNWCALQGDARGSDQCDERHDHGWILHGLWPQYESGFPDYCQTSERAPSRQMTAGMADIMGTSGLAWHQWKKHGTCAGLSAAQYFDTSREAYARINRPEILRRLSEPVRIAPQVVEQAFLEANPDLRPDQITITCRDGHIQEARICLTRALEPRQCGRDVIRDCSAKNALFTPIR